MISLKMQEACGKEKEGEKSKAKLNGLLEILPPVDFCCIYGSTLHPNNTDKTSMIDCIIGVSDPEKWHSENLARNRNHYASWMVHLGRARLITEVADEIGVGVHFNPFVSVNNKMFKYGVVRMHDLIEDILGWRKFYLSGRLQKPVNIVLDNLDLENLNYVNLRAATSAALLLLPPEFTEEEFYAKICELSYMGDVRMFFAEDRDKVKKIVQGQFNLFQAMYKLFLKEYAAKDVLSLCSSDGSQGKIFQDCGESAASTLVSCLPPPIRSDMGMKLGEKKKVDEFGQIKKEVVINSKEEAAECMRRLLRRKVLASSAKQAVAGLLTVGVFHGVQYLGKKMQKAWKSWR